MSTKEGKEHPKAEGSLLHCYSHDNMIICFQNILYIVPYSSLVVVASMRSIIQCKVLSVLCSSAMEENIDIILTYTSI